MIEAPTLRSSTRLRSHQLKFTTCDKNIAKYGKRCTFGLTFIRTARDCNAESGMLVFRSRVSGLPADDVAKDESCRQKHHITTPPRPEARPSSVHKLPFFIVAHDVDTIHVSSTCTPLFVLEAHKGSWKLQRLLSCHAGLS